MPLRSHLLAWYLVLISPLALARAVPPSASEIEEFVGVYRVDETIALIVRDAIYEASMQEGPYKEYYACANSKLTAPAFRPLAIEIVQQQFLDAQSLQVVSEFFETNVGMKLRDAANEVLRQRPVRRHAGKSLDQPGDYLFIPAEVAKIKEFERRPAYQEFRRFRKAINDIGTNPRIQETFKEAQTACSPRS